MSILPVFSNKNMQYVLDRIKPINVLKVYENFYSDRKILYKDFKCDSNSYIYIIVNKLNGKIYVGSTRSMKNRVSNYFNLAHLASQERRPIGASFIFNKLGRASFSTLALQSAMRIPLEMSQYLLNPNFVTGFTDGEGCFLIIIRKNPRMKTGRRVETRFALSLHKKDLTILQLIQNYFNGVGNINKERETSVQFHVTTLTDLTNTIIPHFDKFPLITQKRGDYELFKAAVEIMNSKEHLTIEGLRKIVAIRSALNLGLSTGLKASFSDVVPVQRPLVVDQKIQDPNWLAGFTSGEGNFLIEISEVKNRKLGRNVQLRFRLAQHYRDEQLIKSLIEYFGAGHVYISKEVVDFRIKKFEDLTTKVIPLFEKYPIIGIKALDFADWCKAAELIKNKAHLTTEGLNQISLLKHGMNKGRK